MKETDIRKIERQRRFIQEHTLSPEQRRQLILDKIERARQYAKTGKKREDSSIRV